MQFTPISKWYDSSVSHSPVAASGVLEPEGGTRLDVLIVEDHAPTRRALELTLSNLGHLVFSAATLDDARHLLCAFEIDVLICDLRLPDGDPAAFLAAWPEHSRRVPVVAISGAHDANVHGRCLRAGFDAFLPKPLHVEALGRTLRRLTTRHTN